MCIRSVAGSEQEGACQMVWQLTIVGILVALAAAYVGRKTWQSLRASKAGCGGSCGCAKTIPDAAEKPILIPPDQLTVRRRSYD